MPASPFTDKYRLGSGCEWTLAVQRNYLNRPKDSDFYLSSSRERQRVDGSPHALAATRQIKIRILWAIEIISLHREGPLAAGAEAVLVGEGRCRHRAPWRADRQNCALPRRQRAGAIPASDDAGEIQDNPGSPYATGTPAAFRVSRRSFAINQSASPASSRMGVIATSAP